MAYEHILVEQDRGVAILTMNRPEQLNAMNNQLALELRDAVKAADADAAIGCIVITGAGEKAFSAPRRPIASACSIILLPAPSCAPRRWSSPPRSRPTTAAP